MPRPSWVGPAVIGQDSVIPGKGLRGPRFAKDEAGEYRGVGSVETQIMASDESGEDRLDDAGRFRHARMKRQTAVLMSRRGDVWATELDDISATGALLARPDNWEGTAGDLWVLDMLFHDNLNIHLEARVVRVSQDRIGFEFARIPEDKQAPLWNLLGGYADTLEPWSDLEN